MSEFNNEQLSVLIDGEQDSDHTNTLDRLINDPDMKNTWSRYHLIGDCLRGHLPEKISSHVSTQVNNALRDEPTILSPQSTKRFNMKPIAGFAIAASVAMVAILGLQRVDEINSFSNTPAIATSEVKTTVSQPQSFSFPEPRILPATVKKPDPLDAIANQRLNNYLMNHNEYRSNSGMNGILPYVRIVTIESQE
ncbi:MAG: sigma-E factor negative regulatory protein [Proteobacteria bacterium]|nr:sigma-E factor negative regulatory protein [Pseudomonadota bacterium]